MTQEKICSTGTPITSKYQVAGTEVQGVRRSSDQEATGVQRCWSGSGGDDHNRLEKTSSLFQEEG